MSESRMIYAAALQAYLKIIDPTTSDDLTRWIIADDLRYRQEIDRVLADRTIDDGGNLLSIYSLLSDELPPLTADEITAEFTALPDTKIVRRARKNWQNSTMTKKDTRGLQGLIAGHHPHMRRLIDIIHSVDV